MKSSRTLSVLGLSVVTLTLSVSAHAATASVNGARIPSLTQIVDSSSNVWTVSGGVISKNGTVSPSSGVTALFYLNGVIYQENSAGKIWDWNGTIWAGPITDPRKASPSGASITTDSALIDSSLNVWTVVGGVVKENGGNAGSTGGIVLLLYWGASVYEEGEDGRWWTWNGTTWVLAPNGDPRGTTTTPTPTPTSTASAGNRVAMDDLEAFTPLSSWANAQSKYGATGNGSTNDAPALQKAFNDLSTGKIAVLYLPAGTYKIDSTLTLNGLTGGQSGGVSIVGAGPASTTLLWAGAGCPSTGNSACQPMILQNGGFNTSYSRMTLNGGGTKAGTGAGYGIAQWWNGTSGFTAGTSSQHIDMVFENMDIGINAGRQGTNYDNLDSEGQIRRVTFKNMYFAGLDTGSYNALDWWVWDSQFINCARGVSNDFGLGGYVPSSGAIPQGRGAFYVYRSLFQGSTIADIKLNQPAWMSFHENVSIGSKQFFLASQESGSGPVILEGNRVVNVGTPAIESGNQGTLTMIDNQIQSASAAGPAVLLNSSGDADFVSIGNKYTVASGNVFKHNPSDAVYSLSDSYGVASSSISSSAPSMPGTPAAVTRKVFEVAAGSSSAAIQAAINSAVSAAASGAVNPIVHLPAMAPPGYYSINETLVVPPKAKIQIVGDGHLTNLHWTGSSGGTFIELQGPSYATVRDMQMDMQSATAHAFNITDADQAGGRVFIEGSNNAQFTISNLSQTQISAAENTGFGGLTLSGVDKFVAMGTGGIGPNSTFTNSNTVLSDSWYEGNYSNLYRINGGTFTYMGGQISPAVHSPAVQPIQTAILFNGFEGKASLINFSMDLDAIPNGIGIEVENSNASTNVMVMGSSPNNPSFFHNASTAGNVGLIADRTVTSKDGPSVPLANSGDTSSAFVLQQLAQVRGLVWDTAPYVAPAGATDVRIYRVATPNTLGSTITGN